MFPAPFILYPLFTHIPDLCSCSVGVGDEHMGGMGIAVRERGNGEA